MSLSALFSRTSPASTVPASRYGYVRAGSSAKLLHFSDGSKPRAAANYPPSVV